ncbi:MAG: polyprenol monophosphomannose synthase, partial [Patescibacteria group bacterium]
LARKFPLPVIHRPRKMGLGSAYNEAFSLALRQGSELFFEMDADFSHHPKYIPDFLREIENGYDLVVGSRRVPGGKIENWGPWRRLESGGAMWFSRVMLGLKTRDVTSGFKCYTKKAIQAMDLPAIKSNGYAFQEETIYRCEKAGLKVKEIPIIFTDRQQGKSKLSKKEVFNFFTTILRLKFRK